MMQMSNITWRIVSIKNRKKDLNEYTQIRILEMRSHFSNKEISEILGIGYKDVAKVIRDDNNFWRKNINECPIPVRSKIPRVNDGVNAKRHSIR